MHGLRGGRCRVMIGNRGIGTGLIITIGRITSHIAQLHGGSHSQYNHSGRWDVLDHGGLLVASAADGDSIGGGHMVVGHLAEWWLTVVIGG